MHALHAPSRPELTLLILGYVTIAGAKSLPDEAALLAYVAGFSLLVLIPLLVLDASDDT